MQNTKPILLVEDDEVDSMKTERAFKEIGVKNPLIKTANGEEALLYLRGKDNELPCAILLDLRMPVMGGIEFLKNIKADEILKMIPVIVLTTSEDEKDKIESFNLGIAGYMLKQADYKQFCETIKAIESYWSTSEMPHPSRT